MCSISVCCCHSGGARCRVFLAQMRFPAPKMDLNFLSELTVAQITELISRKEGLVSPLKFLPGLGRFIMLGPRLITSTAKNTNNDAFGLHSSSLALSTTTIMDRQRRLALLSVWVDM